MSDPLSNIKFKESGGGGADFIKFKANEPVKLRVFTTNPTIHLNNYGKEQFSFAVWNYDEEKAMILSKGISIAKALSTLHRDEDFGADITALDIKIVPTGEGMDREYSINPLPKAQKLSDEQLTQLEELDGKLDTIFKTSVRAEQYNEGEKPQAPEKLDDVEPMPSDDDAPIDLGNIPF
jgi:hypothetical protein